MTIDTNLKTNHLAHERSLYLRQHAHNPIDWHPWCDDALGQARQQDKPIFLSIGYASCHWCHVMEQEVFEKHDVAAFMNEHFISIKVDREERPDIDATYMQSVQMMTGSGGWPMSVFLTPDLKPFFGGTYFPHDAFIEITRRVVEVFRQRRDDVERQAASLAGALAGGLEGALPSVFQERHLDGAVREAQAAYDRQWGGFRGRMKFPTPVRWKFLLRRFRKTGHLDLADMVRGTLDPMANGGIRDHLAGGFHRYTVDDRWLVPHFEKMLYDNAQLASLYLEAGAVFGHAPYLQVARETLDFLLREMRDASGAFFASFDADSGGDEGSYYVWSRDELLGVAGNRDGAVLASLLGVTDRGNFDGKNVLWRHTPIEDVATEHDTTVEEVSGCFDRWRPVLLAHRNERTPPTLDRKVVTAWNGLAIQALARAAALLGNDEYLQAAEQATRFLLQAHRRADGSLARASNDGIAGHAGILDDYASLAVALLDLHQASGDPQYVSSAEEIVDFVLERFARPDGGFFLTSSDQQAPLGRRFDPFDSVEPSGNAMLLEALQRLSMLTGRREHRDRVRSCLDAMAGVIERAGLEMAGWLDVGQLHLGPAYEVVVAGDPVDERFLALARTVRSAATPHVALVVVPPSGPDEATAATMPPSMGKVAIEGVPTAYVCAFGTCQAPTTDAAELRSQMMAGWER